MDSRALNASALARLKARIGGEARRWLAEEPPGELYATGELPPSLRETARIAAARSLSSLLPYESYDPETQLWWNSDSVAFLLEVMPAVGLDRSALNTLSGLLTQGLKENSVVQLVLYSDPNVQPLLDHWQGARHGRAGERSEIFETLAAKRADYLATGNWSSLLTDQPFVLKDWRLFISVTRPIGANGVEDAELEWLQRTREAYKGLLLSAKLNAAEISPDAFVRLMDTMLNPQPGRRFPLQWDKARPLGEQVADRDSLLLIGRDAASLVHGAFNVSVLPWSVRNYPLEWPGWQMGELIGALTNNTLRLPCPVLYTQTIVVGDPVSAAGSAKLKSARATQMNDTPMGKFVPAWRERKKDWDFVIKSLEEGHKLLQGHFQIVLFAPLGQEEYCEQRMRAVFESRGWQLAKDRFSVLHSFLAALPMNTGPAFIAELKKLRFFRSMLTWSCINTAPVIGEWKGTGSPLLLLLGRRGQVQFVDPFDNTKGNFNIACAATSGAGKSFFTQELATSVMGTGGRVSVIDAGESYRNLCGLLRGSYLKFTRASGLNINPFSRVNHDELVEELPLLKQLLSQMASPVTPLDSAQLSYLEQAIVAVWRKHGPDSTITAVAAELASAYEPAQRELSVMLYPYTREGGYGVFFEGRANIDLSNPFVVLELDDLVNTPDLQSVVLLTLMLRITEEMYLHDRKLRKLAIIDEAWQLMGQGQAGKFIERGYRTARKYGGAFMTVTQGIGDYYKSPISQAALENADFLFLLRQKPESLAQVRQKGLLHMDDSLEELLRGVDTVQGKYSEIAVKGPAGVSIGRLVVDPFAEKLYSTKAEEFQFIRDAEKAGKSLVWAVEELVRRGAQR